MAYYSYFANFSEMIYQGLLQRRIAADKRKIKDFCKLPLATYFLRKTLSAIVCQGAVDENEGKRKNLEL